MTIYFDTKLGKRQTRSQLKRRGITGVNLTQIGVYELTGTEPDYDTELYTARDIGQEPDGTGKYRVIWQLTAKDVDTTRAAMLKKIATKRWQVETGGMIVNGVPVETDDRSKVLIAGTTISAMQDAEFTTRFKTPTGWLTLDATQIVAIGTAVANHVKACFAREDELVEAINASETPETVDIETGWPTYE